MQNVKIDTTYHTRTCTRWDGSNAHVLDGMVIHAHVLDGMVIHAHVLDGMVYMYMHMY